MVDDRAAGEAPAQQAVRRRVRCSRASSSTNGARSGAPLVRRDSIASSADAKAWSFAASWAKSKPTCGRIWIAGSSSTAAVRQLRRLRGELEHQPAAEAVADPSTRRALGLERLEQVARDGSRCSMAARSSDGRGRAGRARARGSVAASRSSASLRNRRPCAETPCTQTTVGARRVAPLVDVEAHPRDTTQRARAAVRHPRRTFPRSSAVLDEADDEGVNRWLLGGDYGTPSPWPLETLDRLKAAPERDLDPGQRRALAA